MADLAEYAFGISIGIVLFSCYILLNVPPKEWPNAKPRRPSTPTPPPPEVPATTEPYSEEAIVSAMTALYQFLIDLDIIRPDQITFAPEAGHSISTELCESLHLDPKVISLMKRLPYPIDRQASWEFDLLDESRTPPYTDDNDIKDGRDPDFPGIGDGPRLDYLAPTDIALTIGGRYGVTLVLDTQENMIRKMDSTWSERLEEPFQRPDDPHHYQNLRPEPALYVLERYIEKYKSLEWIPKRGRNFVMKGNDEVSLRISHLPSGP